MTFEALCLHLVSCLFDGQGFAPDGRVTFSLLVQRESNQRESTPRIRPRLRRGSLAPSLLRRHAAKGHPWPIAALAASMPLDRLRSDSTRPPEGPRSAAPAYFDISVSGVGITGTHCQAPHESPSGAREVWPRSGQTRMLGRAFFCLLFFARAKKSKAPSGAQPEGAASTAKSALARRIKP